MLDMMTMVKRKAVWARLPAEKKKEIFDKARDAIGKEPFKYKPGSGDYCLRMLELIDEELHA
jgi:hypothetical protein